MLLGYPQIQEPDYRKSTEQDYKPYYNQFLLKQLIEQYQKAPESFREDLVDKLEQDSTFYGMPFNRDVTQDEFNILNTVSQLGTGFLSGFTTFHIGEEPKNSAERIANSIGHLAGFVGYIPKAPFALLGKTSRLKNAADFLRGKSVPMMVANKATKFVQSATSKATRAGIEGKSGAVKAASSLLQGTKTKDTLRQAFHLGVASSVSAWQGGIDEMMRGFMGGATTGAAFGMIGNLIRLPGGGSAPHLGARFFPSKDKMIPEMTAPQKADRAVRTLAASMFTGLPSTMRGDTTPEQIYEYLLGAYFGMKVGPAEVRNRDKHIAKMFADEANVMKDPALTKGYDILSKRERELVDKETKYIWDKRGKIISQRLTDFMGYNVTIPEMSEDYANNRKTMPTPKTEVEAEINETILGGQEVTKEKWSTFSEKEKDFYSESLEVSNFEGYFTYRQLKAMNKEELDAIAERHKIPNRKNMSTKGLASEIMFTQEKRYADVVRKIKLGEDTVLNNQDDTGASSGIARATQSTMSFVRDKILTHKKYENLSPSEKKIENLRLGLELDTIVSEANFKEIDRQGLDRKNLPRDVHYKIDPEEIIAKFEKEVGFRIPPNERGQLLQHIKRNMSSVQEAFLSNRMKGGDLFIDILAYGAPGQKKNSVPVNAKGDKKNLNRPITLLEKIYDTYFPNSKEAPFYVVDEFIIPGERYLQKVDFYRYKEALEKEGLEWQFYKHFGTMFKEMEKDGRYFFGGAGDKEKAYFMKYHPIIEQAPLYNSFWNAIRQAFTPNIFDKLYKQSEEAYLDRFFKHDMMKRPNEPDALHSQRAQQLIEMHKKAFVSNYLYDMEVNGMPIEVKNVPRVIEEGFLSDAKAFNKRAQILFTSGYATDKRYIREWKDSDGKGIGDLNPNGNYNVIFVGDAKGPGMGDLSKAIEYMEITDGTSLLRNDVMLAQVSEHGMPNPEKVGQSKSFIMGNSNDLATGEPLGALMGKYEFVDAGPTLSKMMRDKNLHAIIYKSSAKQLGRRKVTDYEVTKNTVTGPWARDKSLIYELNPEHIHNVYSERNTEHNIQPQYFPVQANSSLTPASLEGKVDPEILKEMQESMFKDSFVATEYKEYADNLLANPKNPEIIEEFFKNFEKIGVPDVLKILKTPGLETVNDRIYEKILKMERHFKEVQKENGEMSEADVESWWQSNQEFTGSTERMMKLSQEMNESILSMALHKWNKGYVDTVMHNWVMHRLTNPVVNNSGVFRMRPYDKRMQQKIDLKEDEFYLDEGARDMKIHTDLLADKGGWTTLGKLWEKRHLIEKTEFNDHFNEILRSVGIRVPMDSVSGARVIKFAGFTGRKGYGILMHPRVMRSLGGADLDGDKAYIFFGGRTEDGLGGGLKESWKDMYKANEAEYTKYFLRSKNKEKDGKRGEITKEKYENLSPALKKLYAPYTTDNKNDVMLEGDYAGITPRELMTLNTEAFPFAEGLLKTNPNDRGVFYYSPFARQFMSEASGVGRQTLGATITNKKVISGMHNSLVQYPDETFHSDKIVVKKATQFQPEEWFHVYYTQKATTDPVRHKQFRNLARTGVALGADPMDEVGTLKKDAMFDILYDSLVDVNIHRIDKLNKQRSQPGKKPVYETQRGINLGKAITRIFGKKDSESGEYFGNEINTKAMFGVNPGEFSASMFRNFRRDGLYKRFRDANSGMFGRDWEANKSYSLAERKEKVTPLSIIREEASNSMMPRLAKMLSKIDYSDSFLARIAKGPTGGYADSPVFRLFKDFARELATKKYDYLLEPLGRRTFTVKSNKNLLDILQMELWIPSKQESLARDVTRFKKIFGPSYKGIVFPLAPKVSLNFEQMVDFKNKNPLEGTNWRLDIIRKEVKKQDDMLMQDLADMISVRRIHAGIKATGMPLDRLNELSERVSDFRAAAKNLGTERKKTTLLNENTETPNETVVIPKENGGKEAVDYVVTEEVPITIKRAEGISSMQTQMEIDSGILKFKEGLNSAEREIFDELMSGSLWRGNLEALKEQEAADLAAGVMTPKRQFFYDQEKLGTAKTGINRFAFGSDAVSDKAIKGFVKDYSGLFNKAIGNTPEAERKKVLSEFDKSEDSKVVDGIETNELRDPLEGFRELKDGKLDKKGRDILEEAETHILHYNKHIGHHLNDLVRGMFKKDLDAMTYEEWQNFNHTMRVYRNGDFFSRKDGAPFIKRMWYHIFPEAINRDMMTKDFELMWEQGVWYTNKGEMRIGEVAKPTHVAQKLLDHAHYSQDQNQRLSDEEISKWRKRMLHLEQSEEGNHLFEIAGREMELKVANDLVSQPTDNPVKAKANAMTYRANYTKTLKKHNWKTLQHKRFEVDTITEEGKVKRETFTGREYVDYLKKQIAQQNKDMEHWGNGTDEYRDAFDLYDANGVAKVFFSSVDGSGKQFDLPKFLRLIKKLERDGKDIPMDIGHLNMRRAIKQFQYESSVDAEHRAAIARKPIFPSGKFESDRYIPHIIMDKKAAEIAHKKAMEELFSMPDSQMSAKDKGIEAQKILFKHKKTTGEWEFEEFKDWELYNQVKQQMDILGEKMTDVQLDSYENVARVGNWQQRTGHLDGVVIEPRVYDRYIRNNVGSFYRSLGQLTSRSTLEKWVKEQKKEKNMGEELAQSFERFFNIYINNAAGYPAVIPEIYQHDPNLKVRGTLYNAFADNKVRARINKIRDALGIDDKSIPKSMRGVDYEQLKNWSNLEAKWQMSALLFHPKTGMGNMYGGSALTASSASFMNLKRANNINWLKSHLNPGKDALGNEWNSMGDVRKYVQSLGVMPEMITYEAGINPNLQKANVKAAISEISKKISGDPEFADSKMMDIVRKYGISERFWDKMSFFMKHTERKLRTDAYMAHLIQSWESFGGALPIDHPILIRMAKKGVKATQFLYNAPHRPLFAQTALGKVMSRFQLWSWNSVRFRNDVIREAAKHGWREGTLEFEKFKRTAQIDLFMLGMSSVFMYSLFEAALPAPWNWFQDTAEWLFGDDKERDRAFFGSWPTAVAPLQMVTPPVLRMAPVAFKGLVDDDWSKLSGYTIWSMFPMGRLARDFFGENSMMTNPFYAVEKMSGLPYMQLGRTIKSEKGKEQIHPKGIMGW